MLYDLQILKSHYSSPFMFLILSEQETREIHTRNPDVCFEVSLHDSEEAFHKLKYIGDRVEILRAF